MSRESAGGVYGFGPFRYDAGQRLLFRDGAVVPLVPKAVDTLHVLLERRGRMVDKAELLRLVWPDTTVEDVGLARNISLLRKALEDESGQEYIETIPKRGYRFVAEVADIAAAPAAAPVSRRLRSWLWIGLGLLLAAIGFVYWQFYVPSRYLQHRAGSAAMAVVPLTCQRAETECTAFASGLNELLAADLSKLDWVEVVSPSTVRRHQRMNVSMGLMGRLLGLDALVEGSVQSLSGRWRVTVNLVDVHTGKLIWADSYEYAGTDSGEMQAEAARRITAGVEAHLAIQQRFLSPSH